MNIFNNFKNKDVEPIYHKDESDLIIKDGKHFFENCDNIEISGKAIVLETTNTYLTADQ